jgi:hypothetical protein
MVSNANSYRSVLSDVNGCKVACRFAAVKGYDPTASLMHFFSPAALSHALFASFSHLVIKLFCAAPASCLRIAPCSWAVVRMRP